MLLSAEHPKGTVIITDQVHPLFIAGMNRNGYHCHYEPAIESTKVAEIVANYTGLLVNSRIKVTAELLAVAPQLKFVARIGAGLEVIDVEAAAARNIKVYSANAGNCNAVAEHALGMLLMLLNHLKQADKEVREGFWVREKNRGRELTNMPVGIIGFGHTGSRLAALMAPFGNQIFAYDKYKPSGYAKAYPMVQACNHPDEVLEHASILSLHLPQTAETKHWLNPTSLNQLPQGAIVVNTARGSNIDTEALILALETGKLGGACLDVLENERPDQYSAAQKTMYERLYALPNTVLSPHIAGWTIESKQKIAEILLQKILEG